MVSFGLVLFLCLFLVFMTCSFSTQVSMCTHVNSSLLRPSVFGIGVDRDS